MPDQVRRKTVTFDGAEFIISPLTLTQTREFAKEDTPTLKVIAASLTRAGQPITETQLEDMLDAKLRKNLLDEILEMSGLGVPEGGASGENKA